MEHSQDVSALSQVIPSLTGGTPEPGASNDVSRPELRFRHSACRFLIRVLISRLVGAPRDRIFHAARPSLVLWHVTLEQAELDLRRLARRHDPPLIGHHIVQRGQFCQRCWRSSHEKKEENADEKLHAGRSHPSFPPRQFDWKLRYFERMSGWLSRTTCELPCELQSTITCSYFAYATQSSTWKNSARNWLTDRKQRRQRSCTTGHYWNKRRSDLQSRLLRAI